MTNPPKVITIYLTAILAILGIAFWLVGFFSIFPLFPWWQVLGFVLLLVAWLVLTIAVSIKGL